MSLEAAPFSGKGIAPFLERTNPECVAACRRATSLVYNLGSGAKVFGASEHLLAPLLALLPHEPAAAGPLATLAEHLTRAAAYPEALACIDAVIGIDSKRVLGEIDAPWRGGKITWPQQQALLALWRGECLLAQGDRDAGEGALAEGARRAEAARVPEPFGLLGAKSPFRGSVADRQHWARVRGARALRLRFEGKDACEARKLKKRKASDTPDPALLAQARAYLDDALAVIGPRVAQQYAGLEPRTDHAHPDFDTAEMHAHAWQQFAYFESALVHEHLGDLASARLHLGRAKWISALGDPTHRHEEPLRIAVERLGATNIPLA